MLFSILSGGSLQSAITSLLLLIPIVVLALSVHETAHGYVAWKCGDPTAYNLGRLTLNPLKHLDPAGTLCMIVFGFGWAKPVPINTRYFRNPKRGMALSAIAGPLSNIFLGAISAVFYGFFYALFYYALVNGATEFALNCIRVLWTLAGLGATVNFTFAVFNLIPVPPFDGSRIALAFLPAKAYFGIMKYEREIMFGILIAMLALSRFGFSPFGWAADKLTNLIYHPTAEGFLNLFF